MGKQGRTKNPAFEDTAGREIEQRRPMAGDIVWDYRFRKWVTAIHDYETVQHCLRPLPPMPEGKGWVWRRPHVGDRIQPLDEEGNADITTPLQPVVSIISTQVRLGYRWCQAVASNQYVEHGVPMLDDGSGQRIDFYTTWRASAIKWMDAYASRLRVQGDQNTAERVKAFSDWLRDYQETPHVRE